MKKIAAILLILLLSVGSVYADTEESNDIMTKVTVNVAQGVVMVDDAPAAVSVAPYLSDNGTTMIEMNTITDAVGAEVKTEGDSVIVTAQNVQFDFMSGSSEMTVGGQPFTMPAALAKSEDGVIVVPLRFFAECLGADVTYDSEKEDVIIKFSNTMGEEGNFNKLLKYSTKDKIGNSKQKWRFNKPEDIDVQESWQYYNGYDFYLTDAQIQFSAQKNEHHYSIDQLYIFAQSSNGYYYDDYGYYSNSFGVLFEKTKGTRADLPYIAIKTRHTDSISEKYIFLWGDYIYTFDVYRDMESFTADKTNAEVDAILDSFEAGYSGGDDENTVDLSKVDLQSDSEPKKEYTDGNLRWSVALKENWKVSEYYGFYNHVTISRVSDFNVEDKDGDMSVYSGMNYVYDDEEDEDDKSYIDDAVINVDVYSLTDGKTVTQWIDNRQNEAKASYNEKDLSVSQTQDVTIGEMNGKMYTAKITSDDEIRNLECYYFEIDGYIYEITLSYDTRDLKAESFLENAHAIINSFKPGKFDKEEIGTLLEKESDFESDKVTKTFENDDLSLEMPCLWRLNSSSNSISVSKDYYYSDMYDTVGYDIYIQKSSLSYYEKDLTKKEKTFEEYVKADVSKMLNDELEYDSLYAGDVKLVKIEFAGKQAYKVEFGDIKDTSLDPEIIYVDFGNNRVLTIHSSYSQDIYGSYIWQIGQKIINSIRFK